jgi:hypothetical protein
MKVIGYKIIMNNDGVYNYDTTQKPSTFLEWVSSQQFINAHKKATVNGKDVELTVFLSTENISEIIPIKYR